MADSRVDVDPNRTPPPTQREVAAHKKIVGDRGLDVATHVKDPPATSSHDDAVAINEKLSEATKHLMELMPELEQAKTLAVNHPVVPGKVRADLDSAFDHIQAASLTFVNAVGVMADTIALRLGPNNVCDECGAGTVDPSEQPPWHWPGCSKVGA